MATIERIYGFYPTSIRGHNDTWKGYEMHCEVSTFYGKSGFRALLVDHKGFDVGDQIRISYGKARHYHEEGQNVQN